MNQWTVPLIPTVGICPYIFASNAHWIEDYPWLISVLVWCFNGCRHSKQLAGTAALNRSHVIVCEQENSFRIPLFRSASRQRTTRVSLPSACTCARRSTRCVGAPTCWRAPCPPTCPASASPRASPSPTPGYAPTPSPDERSESSASVHFLFHKSLLGQLFSCLAQWEDLGVFTVKS